MLHLGVFPTFGEKHFIFNTSLMDTTIMTDSDLVRLHLLCKNNDVFLESNGIKTAISGETINPD